MDVIGERFGSGFQLLREIGRGARARVFLASDGTEVRAVKLFPAELRGRAEHEVRCLRGLEHDYVVAVGGTVEIRGFPGVVMDYVPGVRLGVWLEHNFSRERFLRVFDAVLAALDAVHAHGLVHRDVKPENILVDREARPRLIDFDLALRIGDPLGRRTLAGTVAYLSPEQTRGEEATPASDLYAAGVILYRGLTGEVPFSGSVADVVEAHRSATPPPPSTFDGRLEPFDALLGRLLAKGAGERYDRAAEVRSELADIGARLPGYV